MSSFKLYVGLFPVLVAWDILGWLVCYCTLSRKETKFLPDSEECR